MMEKTSNQAEHPVAARPQRVPPPDEVTLGPKSWGVRMAYWWICFSFRTFGRLWLRQKLIGLENVPQEGPVLVLPTE